MASRRPVNTASSSSILIIGSIAFLAEACPHHQQNTDTCTVACGMIQQHPTATLSCLSSYSFHSAEIAAVSCLASPLVFDRPQNQGNELPKQQNKGIFGSSSSSSNGGGGGGVGVGPGPGGANGPGTLSKEPVWRDSGGGDSGSSGGGGGKGGRWGGAAWWTREYACLVSVISQPPLL